MIVRVLPYELADGARNMGLDMAMLEAVDARPQEVLLRFYGWSEPTLSLGYFQRYDDAATDPRWRGVAVVRRPTGGGAIWHAGDLTYALAVPRTLSIARGSTALYRTVHGGILNGLRSFGVAAWRRGEAFARSQEAGGERRRPFLCFEDADPEDLVDEAGKLAGSAQRRRPRAVLQHGSIAIWDRAAGMSRIELSERLASALASAMELEPRGAEWTREMRAAAEKWAGSQFGTAAWTRRR